MRRMSAIRGEVTEGTFMAKTHAPGEVTIAGRTIKTNAVPDPFDALDLVYRPRLQILPDAMDHRAGQPILDQIGQSCTGHAVAALIDTVLSEPLTEAPEHGAPRRSDDKAEPVHALRDGPALRRVPRRGRCRLVAPRRVQGLVPPRGLQRETWRSDLPDPDLYDPSFIAECMKTPLGAYYRVNARRIDDMQSAMTRAQRARGIGRDPRGLAEARARDAHGAADLGHRRRARARALGGHAFLLAGYNDVGFLVQNSWGTDVGPQRLRDAALCRLARQRLRRVGRPARRPAGRHRPQRRKVIPAGGGLVVGAGIDLSGSSLTWST